MNHQQIEFDANGFTFQNKRVLWTSDAIPASYPEVMFVIVHINQAQKKWSRLDAHKIPRITKQQANKGLPDGATETDQIRFEASVYFSSLLEAAGQSFFMTFREGFNDEKNNENTLSRQFFRQLMLNPDLLHLLSILEPNINGPTLAFLERYKDYFPDYVPCSTPINIESLVSLEWLKNPMETKRKLRFNCANGRLVPNDQ